MNKIQDIQTYTQAQLIEIMQAQRKAMEERFKDVPAKPTVGKELFLDTEAGRVRVLAYNMDKPGKLPVFVNLHGSGFVVGHAEMDDAFMPAMAEEANVRILNVDYSLAPENPFPRALEEIWAVMKYAKAHADELGIDGDRICVGGHSAGGNFSAALCLMDAVRGEVGIRCAILDYPPLDVCTDAYLKPNPQGAIPPEISRLYDACYLNDKEGRKNPLISPLFATDGQLRKFPPTLVLTAQYDSLCDEAERFAKRLEQAGATVRYRCFQGCYHGFTHQDVPEAGEAWQMMVDFLKKYL